MPRMPQPDADGWLCVGRVTDCPIGQVITVPQPRWTIAVFHLESGWVAIKDQCPHADQPLSRGSRHGNVVTCPGHNWQFDLATGACVRGELDRRLRTFPTEQRGDEMWVMVR